MAKSEIVKDSLCKIHVVFFFCFVLFFCETSQLLLAGGQVVFSGISCFRPTLRLTRLKRTEIILTCRKTQIKRFSFIESLRSAFAMP